VVFVPFFFVTGGLSFALIVLTVNLVGTVMVAVFLSLGAALAYLVRKGVVLRNDPSRPGVSAEVWLTYIFFDGPLPTLLGVAVIVGAPAYLPVMLALLVSQVYLFLRRYRWALRKVASLRG
jgi:hypothetical protein